MGYYKKKFTRMKSDKKKSHGGKPKVRYITGGKSLLTLYIIIDVVLFFLTN